MSSIFELCACGGDRCCLLRSRRDHTCWRAPIPQIGCPRFHFGGQDRIARAVDDAPKIEFTVRKEEALATEFTDRVEHEPGPVVEAVGRRVKARSAPARVTNHVTFGVTWTTVDRDLQSIDHLLKIPSNL